MQLQPDIVGRIDAEEDVAVVNRTMSMVVRVAAVVVVVGLAVLVVLWALPRFGGPSDEPSPTASPAVDGPNDPVATDAGDLRGVTTDEPAAGASSLAFTSTGLAGGGFQNAVAFSPDGKVVLVGGDNAGLHRSTDGGVTWTPVSAGLPVYAAKIAAIAFDPSDPSVALAAAGFAGQTGGVLRSEDGGQTWAEVSQGVQFSGSNTPKVDGVPDRHPRSTGALLVWAGDAVYAGSFDAGVARSKDGGASWRTLDLDGLFIRGIAVDAGGDLLVGTYGDGLWRVQDPDGAANAVRVPGGPSVIEEVTVAGDTVLVAAGTEGLWRWDGAWSQVHDGDANWSAIAWDGGGRLWAGAHDPGTQGSELTPAVLRSTDDGQTWEPVARGAGLLLDVAGSDGLPWWVATAQASFMPDGTGFTAAQFAVDPTDPDRVLLAGRAGLWGTTDGGDTWRPHVAGLGATTHDAAATDAFGRIVIANTDHRLLVSDDGLRTVVAVEPGATKGTTVAADVVPGAFLVATAERDGNRDGELYRLLDDGSLPKRLDLAAETGGKRILAVTSGFDQDEAAVIVAAVEESGVWRHADGSWTRMDTPAFVGKQPTADGQALWLPSGPVLLLDRTSGLWRSLDGGLTWDLAVPLATATTRTDPTGFITVARATATTDESIWLSTVDGLIRVEELTAPRVQVVTPVPGARDTGPLIELDDGTLVFVTRERKGVLPTLQRVCDGVPQEVAVGARFRGGAIDVVDLDLDSDGHLIVTTATNGVIRSAVPAVGAIGCSS